MSRQFTPSRPDNAWLAQMANACELSCLTQMEEADKVRAKPSTYARRKRIERHISQAHHEARQAIAFRELLDIRQRIAKATEAA
jgi:hypothetical protein